MKVHTEKFLSVYTGHKSGGNQDIAHIELTNMTLVDNVDLARLRQIASCIDDSAIPQHIMEVLEACALALRGTNTVKAKNAMAAIKDLLKGAAT